MMNKKSRIYRKLVRYKEYESIKTEFKVTKLIFTRTTRNKKCSTCKYFGTSNNYNSCRHYDLIIKGKVMSLYRFCSRNQSLNCGYKGKYTLRKLENVIKTTKNRKITGKI